MNLWQLTTYRNGIIIGFSPELPELYRQRLRELGFEKSCEVICLRSTPFNGPKVFQIGDSVFSLTREIAQHVILNESDK